MEIPSYTYVLKRSINFNNKKNKTYSIDGLGTGAESTIRLSWQPENEVGIFQGKKIGKPWQTWPTRSSHFGDFLDVMND